jgi:hypothetical protein
VLQIRLATSEVRLPKLRAITVHEEECLHLSKVQIRGRLAKADLNIKINFPKDYYEMSFAEVLPGGRATATG